MNEQVLEYKGYLAKVVESEIGGLKGTVTNFDDDCHFITFRAATLEGIQEEFKGMMDWYLETCQRDGVEPSKPKILSVACTG